MTAAQKLQLACEMTLDAIGWPQVLDYWMAQGFTKTSRRLVISYLVPARCEELHADGHEMTNQQWADLAGQLCKEAAIRMDCVAGDEENWSLDPR